MISATWTWIILLVLFCIAEGLTAGLVSIWFVCGSLGALAVSLLKGSVALQIAVFVVITLVTMLLIRPLARKVFTPKHQPTNADRILGQEAAVTVPIDPIEGTGQVKLDGKVWTARSLDGSPIPEGARVVVRRIEGVKVLVEVA